MSENMEVAYQRKISDVTRDIRIQTGQFLRTAIEIGRLLFEAKAMVEPGGWSRYIEEELPFSHSWANNYMKLYKEFGSDQTSLFGDSQAFMNLRPTQAMELLALPAAEREAFVQTHDVEDMSTRQLRQAIKDLEDTKKELEETDEALGNETERREALEHELGEVKESAKTAWQEVKAAEQEAAAAKDKQYQAEKKIKQLEEQLLTAQKAEKTAQEELKKAKENPDIPESMMEQLRREAEADAAREAAKEVQSQLEEVQAELEVQKEEARKAQEKLNSLTKSQKLNNPDMMAINTLAKQMLAMWDSILEHRKRAAESGEENLAPIGAFLRKVVDTMEAGLEG